MPRKGENIYKRKDGRWEGRYIKNHTPIGKTSYGYVYGKTYLEVKNKLIIAKQQKVLSLQLAKNTPQDILFQNIAFDWLNSLQPQIKASTYNKYRNILNLYLLPEFGAKELSSLTYIQMENFSTNLLISGGIKKSGLSPKTVTDIISLLRNILRFAVNRGYSIPCNGKNITVKQSIKKMRILSISEQTILVNYLFSDLNKQNAGILICLFTGIRIGEICALKWGDISLNDKTLYIHQTMQRIQIEGNSNPKTKIQISTPKSEASIRTIPLPSNLVTAISIFKDSDESFFLTGTTDKYVEPRVMQNHFKRVLTKCHIDNANFHSLRHTFATRCIELGFDVKSLSEILGHTNVNITMNRYVHPSMDLKRDNMQRLADLIAVK